jgi:hypothetical protein
MPEGMFLGTLESVFMLKRIFSERKTEKSVVQVPEPGTIRRQRGKNGAGDV